MDIFSVDSRSFRECRELTLKEVIKIDNFYEAYLKIKKKNKGSGINEISLKKIEEEELYFLMSLIKRLELELYFPKLVKVISIEKKNGKIRNIGVLCIEDKIIQQSILNILTPIYEEIFFKYSYGYRRKLSYIDGVKKVEELLKNGYRYILDLDIENFFDSINLEILKKLLEKNIKDKKLMKLIERYLYQRSYFKGKVYKRSTGLIQGSILSPLFSNIYLHNLDLLMDSKEIKMVRYADDFIILLKDQKNIKRSISIVESFLNGYKLKLNYEKSKIIDFKRVNSIKFLGQIIYKSW